MILKNIKKTYITMNSSFDFCTLSELRRREQFHVNELQRIRDEIQRRESLGIDHEGIGFLTPEQIREKQGFKGKIVFPQDIPCENEKREIKITQKGNQQMKELYIQVNMKQGRQQIQEEILKSYISKPSKQIKRLRKQEEEDWEKEREFIEDELPIEFQKKLNIGIYREVSNSHSQSNSQTKPKRKIIKKKEEIDFGSSESDTEDTRGAGRAAPTPIQSIIAPTHSFHTTESDDDEAQSLGDDGTQSLGNEYQVSTSTKSNIYQQSPLLNDLWK
jgi:hypothetical protein